MRNVEKLKEKQKWFVVTFLLILQLIGLGIWVTISSIEHFPRGTPLKMTFQIVSNIFQLQI